MDTQEHNIPSLFEQLGLPNSAEEIQHFLATHHVAPQQSLPEAEFWTEAQAAFLREAWEADAEWVMTIDELNASLRKTPAPTHSDVPAYDISRPETR